MSASSASPRISSYIPAIDGLRAFAVLSVMLFHLDSSFLPGGFSGVDVFFVISGYVVSRAMLERGAMPLHRYLADFFSRRFVRILPALVVCLSVTAALSVLLIPHSWLSSSIRDVGIWAYFGASNMALLIFQDGYFSPRAEFNPFTHTWSLGVEEQFYLVLPALLLGWTLWQRGDGFKAAAIRALLPLLAMASLAAAWWLGRDNQAGAYYLLPTRFWELAAGVMLSMAQYQGRAVAADAPLARIATPLGLVLVMLGFWLCDGDQFPFPWALLPVVGTALCLYGVSLRTNSPSSVDWVLTNPLSVYIGRISYSLYLWHWPVYSLFRWTLGLEGAWMLLALAITFACAALSYHLVEQPVRNSRWLKRRSPAVKLVAGLLVVAAFAWLAHNLFLKREQLSLSVTKDTYTWYPYEYQIQNLPEGEKPLAGRQIYVFGNSHTGAYSTMLQEASDRLGIKVTKLQTGFCNMGNLMINIGDDPDCAKQGEEILATIERTLAPGDLVFLASLRTFRIIDQWAAFDYSSILPYSHEPYSLHHPLHVLDRTISEVADLPGAAAGRAADTDIIGFADLFAYSRSAYSESRRQLALTETEALISRLAARGIRVLVDAPKPVFQMPPYRCADRFNRMNPICALGGRVSRDQLLQLRQPVMESLGELERKFDTVTLWDPFPVLCPGEVCSAFDDKGAPLFFDGDHLSAQGNRLLYPSFEKLLLDMEREGSIQTDVER